MRSSAYGDWNEMCLLTLSICTRITGRFKTLVVTHRDQCLDMKR